MEHNSIWKQGNAKITRNILILTVLITGILIWLLGSFDVKTSHNQVTESEILSPLLLAILRTIIAIGGFTTIAYVLTKGERDGNVYHTNSSKFEIIIMKGTHRLSTFTCWSFIGLSLTFTILAISSWLKVFEFQIPHILLKSASILFPVIFACSLLVTLVVTFILIPSANKRGDALDNWFKLPELIMHNANLIVLMIELMIGNLVFDFRYLPLVVMFGIAYVIFAAIHENKTGVYYYSFLDPRTSKSAFIHVALLIAIISCFSIIFIVELALNKWLIPTALLLMMILPFILYVRNPTK